jgi:hypothetical protein
LVEVSWRGEVKTIQVKLTVDVPQVPNFLRTSDGQSVPLCAVTDDGLREIAAQWTADLLARSKEQAKNPALNRSK